MIGKLKPRNLDFFDFPGSHHQEIPEMPSSYREPESMWAVIGESRDQKTIVPNISMVTSSSFIIGQPSPDHLHQAQSHMIVDNPLFVPDGYLGGDNMQEWNAMVEHQAHSN